MFTDPRNQVRWGNVVELPVMAANATYTTTIFDTQTSLFGVPKVCTLSLDLEDPSSTGQLYSQEQYITAIVEVGLGAYRRKFEIDFAAGQQLNFAANSVRVDVKRVAGVGALAKAICRASIAEGSRSTSAKPPTLTTQKFTASQNIPGGSGVDFVVPKHAKSFRLLALNVPVGGDMRVRFIPLNQCLTDYTLTVAQIKAMTNDGVINPVNGPKILLIADAAAGIYNCRIEWQLDL